MSLTQSYISYLRATDRRSGASELTPKLGNAGYALESALLDAYGKGATSTLIADAHSAWSGRRAWLGPHLPPDASIGDIWFDTVELTPMILLPFPPDKDTPEEHPAKPYAWMSLRPVAQWQFEAFLTLAEFTERKTQISPPFPLLDRARILSGTETAPVTGITLGEAGMYGDWMWKGLNESSGWQSAQALLAPAEFQMLWSVSRREWGGEFQEGVEVVLSRETCMLDVREEFHLEDDSQHGASMFYSDWDIPENVSFRTQVLTQFGLIDSTGPLPWSLDNVQLARTLRRD